MTDTDESSRPEKPAEIITVESRPHGNGKGSKLAIALSLLAFLIALAALGAPYWMPAQQSGAQTSADESRIAALAAQLEQAQRDIAAIQAQPAPQPADTTELQQKIADIAQQIEIIRASVPAAGELADMRNNFIAASGAVKTLQDHVDRLETAMMRVTGGDATTRALMIAYVQLREALATAAPYEQQLAALRRLLPERDELQDALRQLDKYARTGVPTIAMLDTRLRESMSAAIQASREAGAVTWWQRVLAEMQGVVRVRRVDGDEDGPNGERLLRQAEITLLRGEIAKAVKLVDQLPQAAQQQLADWQKDARARATADGAFETLGTALSMPALSLAPKPASSMPSEISQP